ncbi:hypothetical protein MTR67_031034 [Solanum verrucosum]|uniref:Uncharacterized protein n=1 Tax=Solanum verrucosum TaxID=315347 RepID=A0AAF0U1Q7_SOLVR|nr:hypothetical protein MTR67_031034 [Solanum verrucosum]
MDTLKFLVQILCKDNYNSYSIYMILAGLDQAFIDALLVFLYKEVVGPKELIVLFVCVNSLIRIN